MLERVDRELNSFKGNVERKIGTELWTKAYDCEAGCHCENIHYEYDQIIRWQVEL